jgi:hypothetical protein
MEMSYPGLPCGRDPLDLWDAAMAGLPDSHPESCPSCLELSHQFLAVAGLVRAWREVGSADPTPDILSRVVAQMRAAATPPSAIDGPLVTPPDQPLDPASSPPDSGTDQPRL